MVEFDFYLSYYGLILGLSVAQVASGFLNAIGARNRVRTGLLTPALAVFIFLDITSFWIYAWAIRDTLTVSWGSMYLGLLVSLLYFFASGLVFPRDVEEWPDLDAYYWKHKRLVIGGILIANSIVIVQTVISHPPEITPIFIYAQANYWPPLILLLFSKRRWQDLTLLGILNVGYVTNAFLPHWVI